MVEKPLIWVGRALGDLRAFPDDARSVAGFQLWRLQRGLDPNDWKPMPSIAAGVREIRIHTSVEHRVVVVAKFEEGIYVLHAFEKRSRKTGTRDLDVARSRWRSLVGERARRGR